MMNPKDVGVLSSQVDVFSDEKDVERLGVDEDLASSDEGEKVE